MSPKEKLSNEPVAMWRCSSCGKWSHAARRPTRHQRMVYDEPEDESTVISYEPGYSSEYDESADGWWIKCGPFDSYRAVLVPREETK